MRVYVNLSNSGHQLTIDGPDEQIATLTWRALKDKALEQLRDELRNPVFRQIFLSSVYPSIRLDNLDSVLANPNTWLFRVNRFYGPVIGNEGALCYHEAVRAAVYLIYANMPPLQE